MKTVRNGIHKRLILVSLLLLIACNPCPKFEPKIQYCVTDKRVQALPTPFEPLVKEELQTLWGKELYLGTRFAEEADFYRAITAFKSAYYLIPKKEEKRKLQIEYSIVLSYYFAGKYKEALEAFEASSLISVDTSFPALRELLILLYDTYDKTNFCEKRDRIYEKISQDFPETAASLTIGDALVYGDICTLNEFNESEPINQLLLEYRTEMKSPQKAKQLQAILPGAGYYYVGLKNAAITSFIINALFIAGTYQLFHKGYPTLALFTLSLESGWYLGGINGAELAANEFNERLYEGKAKEVLTQEKLFPVLMFQYAF